MKLKIHFAETKSNFGKMFYSKEHSVLTNLFFYFKWKLNKENCNEKLETSSFRPVIYL